MAMNSISALPSIKLAESEALDWGNKKCVVDLGGGSGIFCFELLKQYPQLNAILFEIPNVCKYMEPKVSSRGLSDRMICSPGDLFKDDYPKTFNGEQVDVMFLSQIFHDWSVEKGFMLAQKSYDALAEGGIIVIHEKLLSSERSRPRPNVLVTLDMLAWCDGQQYTFKKLEEILLSVGFKNVRYAHTAGYFGAVWAEK
eukprot:TRINITY_DN4570_c0_g1_i2.p2 TRINITY_DN4570_c0_g1~~TRINITY_DN4570_c0_g1_i2.p2  ORF type:complete len:198 (-),score=51.89 TRINITY_DN4570_c0_g1_i2:2-595(-)